MKQKIVIRVYMNHDKCRTKAMKIAVCVPGVESAALKGDDKDQVEVVGEGIDSVQLTRRLRKKVAYAELLSVGEVKKDDSDKKELDYGPLVAPPYCGCPPYYSYDVTDPPPCTIL